MRRYFYLLLVFIFIQLPPLSGETTQEILGKLEQNSLRQQTLVELLWNNYLTSEENLKNSELLTKSLEKKLNESSKIISSQETTLSSQEFLLTKTSDSLKSLEKDYLKVVQANKFLKIGLVTTLVVAAIEGVIYAFR